MLTAKSYLNIEWDGMPYKKGTNFYVKLKTGKEVKLYKQKDWEKLYPGLKWADYQQDLSAIDSALLDQPICFGFSKAECKDVWLKPDEHFLYLVRRVPDGDKPAKNVGMLVDLREKGWKTHGLGATIKECSKEDELKYCAQKLSWSQMQQILRSR